MVQWIRIQLGNVLMYTPMDGEEPYSANYYKGTVSDPDYAICENYCAVRATCKSDGTWQIVGFTW